MKKIERRKLLKRGGTGIVGTVLLTGCVSNTDSGDNQRETNDTSDTEVSSPRNSEDNMDTDTGETDTDDAGTNKTSAEGAEQSSPSVQEATLDQRPVCRDAVVTFSGETVTVIGCVTGSNGCHKPVLTQAVIDGSTLQITVESTDTSAEGTACTSVITKNGYRVCVRTDGSLPETVTVVHDDINGEQTVVTAGR